MERLRCSHTPLRFKSGFAEALLLRALLFLLYAFIFDRTLEVPIESFRK
ncbi:MAG: hypothetical protein N838_23710 [Thiohalocapsa sp. PB-PSB1]|nr:MAG: hypothetical protein N838_23710 [Thiohalocapsa sp. PB-PSB1]